MKTELIGVTGGIGSGKSVVCRVCALRGIPVYDCDSRARHLMQGDPALRRFIQGEVGEEAYLPDGRLDTALVSRHIFSDPQRRHRIEEQVHRAVRDDIERWLVSDCAGRPVAMVESAILHTSHLDKRVDAVWLVDAPVETRIRRVKERSALTEEEVLRRMAAQRQEFDSLPPGKTVVVDNSGHTPLLPQISRLLANYNTSTLGSNL